MTGEYAADADDVRRAAHGEPMSLAEYVEAAFDDPSVAAHASRYLLEAIEAAGTRTVVEEGEELERYRFFDDPHNDGEHAVLGNTAALNDVVDDLRAAAADRGKAEKILWFAGPTATGKSELKRCLINGLREYSRTEAGRRYTLEWNTGGADTEPATGLTYGDAEEPAEWERSPVQTHPLSVFPAETRDRLLADLEDADDGVPVRADADLDPYSRELYEEVENTYRERGREDVFSAATDRSHLRVSNYVVDVGQGVGVLHAEDAGTTKERLVGTWMPELLREFDARGRKHPGAFSYDGVLSQGNGGLTVVEDAAQHADLLQKLLNVPDERAVKLDKGVGMDLDTQLVIISNPDLESQLNQHADRGGQDPLKALKRRLSKHRFDYLTNRSLEVQLLRRELAGETAVWETTDREELEQRVRAPLHVTVRTGAGTADRELAPHALAATALYAVVTRLDDDLPAARSLVDKALLFDRGHLEEGDERLAAEEFEMGSPEDGTNGIPVTYTRDVLADLLHEPPERHHPDLDVGSVVTPEDVLDALADGLADAPVFSPAERAEFEERVVGVKDHVFEAQEADVREAALFEHTVDDETVAEYVEGVYAWATDETVENDRGEPVEPDPLKMQVFETEHLGFSEGDYGDDGPNEGVRSFREQKVITAINRHAWEHRTEDFRADAVDLREIPVIRGVLEASDWADVRRIFPDLDPGQWDDPPANTETEAVKDDTIANMVEHAEYTPASAELASRRVMAEVDARWD